MNRKVLALALALMMGVSTLSACSENTLQFDVSYKIESTKHNQYFAVTASTLLNSINEKLSADNLSLSIKDSGNDSAVYYSENGDTWKINVDVFTEGDVENTNYESSSPSSDPANWVDYIHKVELSLFSDGDEMSARNGHYIRALISTFTPGAEKFVEDALGFYNEPHKEAIISDGVYRATLDNVVYTYLSGNKRFEVTPYDESLYAQASEEQENILRPD